jgi:peptide-methionine (S)-S-oxide reductase
LATEIIDRIKPQYLNPIVTEISQYKQFFPAEPLHQNFFKFNRESGYSIFVIEPKLKFLKRRFEDKIIDSI